MKKFKGKFLTVPCDGGGGRGYLSRSFKEGEPFELWAQIDLGGEERFDRIVLYPTRCPELGDIVGTGYGFPVRFKIEGSDDEAFNNKSTLLYETSEDIPNPGKEPYEIVLPEAASARFVRLTVIKPYVFPESDGKPTASSNFFSLDEIMIFRGEENLALHKKVKAPNVTTPIEVSAYDWHQVWAYDWHPDCLTDGIAHIREVRRDRGSGNLLRGVFRIGKPVKRALAHIASKGWYELYINGHRVGDAVLDSGRTQFDKRLLYSTLDARELLKEGENTVVIMLGNGWTLEPSVIFQLDMEHSDGNHSNFCTDENWRQLPGPVIENHVFHGEIYDAALHDSAVYLPGYDDSAFPFAKVLSNYHPKLSPQEQPPIRICEEIKPISITQPQPGVWVFDMGKNIAGWARLRVKTDERREIKLRFAETIFDDGSIWTDEAQAKAIKEENWEAFKRIYLLYNDQDDIENEARFATAKGMINNFNYRCARVTDRYICRGDGTEEVWEPRFTYHGFRFVEISNFPGTPTEETITGCAVHTDVKSIGSFECSNPVLNWAYEASRQTLLNNLHSVPTDCPQRDERQGWGGDAHFSCEAMLLNFDAVSTYRKWLRDARDCQREDGAMPDTVPYSIGRMGGDIAWGGAWIFIAWYAYLYSGEPGILKENFESMLRYLDYLEKCHPDYFADNARYKDWLGLENTPGAIVENAWWHEAAVLVAKAAGALGRKEEQLRLETVAKKIAAEFHRRLFNAEKGYYGSGSQTSNVLPLYFGMVPNELRQSVFEKLVENIESRGRHLSTGITATKQLLELLCQFGREDLAFAIATTEDFPGWGYMKKHGATAIWEHWEHLTGMGMNSHDHPALANIASWLTKCLAGIRPDPENPSFGNIIIAPCFPDGLDWAKAELEISQGKIRSSWKREGKSIFLQLKIPGNCAAVLRINRHFKLLGSQKNVVNREKTPNGISGIHLKSGSFKLKIDA